MIDMKIHGFAGKLAANANTAVHASKKEPHRSLHDFAAMLQERIEERRQLALTAAMSGATLQQRILGISDAEWKRLDMANSSLTMTDEERDSSKDRTSPVAANDSIATGTAGNTETISRVLGDGSTLIITTRGSQVVSTQKIAPDALIVTNPHYVAPESGGIGASARKTITKNVASMRFF